MKRVKTIRVDDGNGRAAALTVEFNSTRSGLTRGEVEDVIGELADRALRTLDGLPYCTFRISNARVR